MNQTPLLSLLRMSRLPVLSSPAPECVSVAGTLGRICGTRLWRVWGVGRGRIGWKLGDTGRGLVSLGKVSWFRCVEDLILLGLFLVARSGPSVVTGAGLAVLPSLTCSSCSPCCCCSPVTSLTGSTT